MNPAAGHGARNRVEDFRLDPRCFVGNDQHLLAVKPLKVFGLIGREAKREIVVAAELDLGGLELGKRNIRVIDQAVDLKPELSPYLPQRGRGRKHDAFGIPRQPPQSDDRERERLADPMAGFDRGAPVRLDRLHELDLARPEIHSQNVARKVNRFLNHPADVFLLLGRELGCFIFHRRLVLLLRAVERGSAACRPCR